MAHGRPHLAPLLLLLLFLCAPCLAPQLHAQDTRNVTEPRYPTACKVLYAELSAKNGQLPEEPIERHYRDNDRIAQAMDSCPRGQAVVLRASKNGRNIFLISPLRLRAGVTLVIDQSAAVWGSRDPRNYDVTPGSCGLVGPRGPGCLPLILAEDAPHSGLMGDGILDGRGGAKLLGQNETWWELAHRAKVEDSNQAVTRLLVVRRSNDFTLYNITLRNSPNCHVTLDATSGFTAWAVKLDTPKWARNTDGIDPQAGSSNLSIIDSYIRSGDDNISPKSTFQGGAVTHMTVRDVHFYNGHGFGIGSQTSGGLSAIRVDNLSIDGASNGIRIKSDRSRGGLVSDVRFENVCMRGVENPIVLNPFYTTFEGTRIPVYRDIVLRNLHALNSGGIILAGLDSAHKLEATLDNVVLDGERTSEITARHAVLQLHRGNLEPSGEDLHVTGSATGPGGAYNCASAFVPFPENTLSPRSAELIPPPDNTFYVAADGTGDFYSVQDAVARVPATGGVISVAPGTYRERLFIPQNHVTLRSANPDPAKTVIVFNLSHATRGDQQGSATVRVHGDDFTAENITFENDYKPSAGDAHLEAKNDPHPPADDRGRQASALALQGDRNLLRNVHLLGTDGTLYVAAHNCPAAAGNNCDPARTFADHVYISGAFALVIGDATLWCEQCELNSLPSAAPGFLTAQGRHYPTEDSLFVFRNARLTADPGVSNVVLGKPLRDFASVVFLSPALGPQISAAGWREWKPGSTHRLESAYFRIFQPANAPPSLAGLTLTAQEAARYTPAKVLAGRDHWNPTAP